MNRNLQEQALIDIMRKLESADGKYTDHAPLSDGTQAVGQYAIKPTTAMEMKNRVPASDIPQVNDRFEMQKALEQSPDAQEAVMTELAKHLLQKNKGQLDPAAMGYFKGHNRSMDRNVQDLDKLNLYKDRLDKAKEELNIMPTLYNKMLKGPM